LRKNLSKSLMRVWDVMRPSIIFLGINELIDLPFQ